MGTHDQKPIELNDLSLGSCFGYNFRLTFYRENMKLFCYSHSKVRRLSVPYIFINITEWAIVLSFNIERMFIIWVLTLPWTGKNAPAAKSAWRSVVLVCSKCKMEGLCQWMRKNVLVVRVVLRFVNKMRFPLRNPGFKCRISAWPSCVIFCEYFHR